MKSFHFISKPCLLKVSHLKQLRFSTKWFIEKNVLVVTPNFSFLPDNLFMLILQHDKGKNAFVAGWNQWLVQIYIYILFLDIKKEGKGRDILKHHERDLLISCLLYASPAPPKPCMVIYPDQDWRSHGS